MADTHPTDDLAQELLGKPYDDLTPIQKSVIDLICAEAPADVGQHLKLDDRTFWQRLADRVAEVGGSWGFIMGFGIFLVVWIGINVLLLGRFVGKAFDPYPFIFLNLMLSMLAAIQAPVIMMSQNRAAAKDRQQAEHDYMVNLRAELEIMRLHDKVDELRTKEVEALMAQQTEALKLLRREVNDLAKGRTGPVKPAPPARAESKPPEAASVLAASARAAPRNTEPAKPAPAKPAPAKPAPAKTTPDKPARAAKPAPAGRKPSAK